MDPSIVSVLVTGVLSTGFGSVVTVVVQGRQTARKIGAEAATLEQKMPAEVDSVAIQGAESAVTMLRITNQTIVDENIRLRAHVTRLEELAEGYRVRLETAESALAAARREYAALEAEIESFRLSTPPQL